MTIIVRSDVVAAVVGVAVAMVVLVSQLEHNTTHTLPHRPKDGWTLYTFRFPICIGVAVVALYVRFGA